MSKTTKKTLINVLGAGRSGTTMLDLMLGNDPESFSLGEVSAWYRPYRKHHRNIDCNCGNPSCPYWLKLLSVPESEFHTNAFSCLGCNYLVDSSKSLDWVIDNSEWAIKNKIKVINIVIYKPVLSYINSIWKRGESINASLRRYKSYHHRLFDSGVPFIAISFTELLSKPDLVLNEICLLTGQKFDLSRKNFWDRNSHQIFGSNSVRFNLTNKPKRIELAEKFTDEFNKHIPEFEKIISNDKALTLIENRLL